MKKIVALILAALMVISLAACGGSEAPAETTAAAGGETEAVTEAGGETEEETTEAETEDPYADAAKEIVVGIQADPAQFIPWGGFSQGGRNIFPMLYQTLLSDVRDPETGDIQHYHALMESYEQTDDTHYTVKIYDNIMDTAGNHMTADDVIFSWDGFKQGPAAANISGLVGYEKVDDYTINCEVVENLGIGDFEEILTTVNMVTKAAYEASADGMATDPVGTTAYVLSEYVPGSYCVVTLNEGEYWNQAANDSKDIDAGYVPTSDNTNVKTVRFEFITDTNTMALALENGDIDIATSVSVDDIEFYQSDDNYSVHQYPDNMFGLMFNCSDDSVFKNENLRKAVAYSVSAQDLLDTIYNGDGWTLKAFAMDYQIGYQKSWDGEAYFEQDKDAAKKYFEDYLKEAGIKADAFKCKLLYTSEIAAMPKYAEVVQAALIELTGNKDCCELASTASATYGTERQDTKNWDLAILNSMSNKTYILYNWKNNFNGYQNTTTNNDCCYTGDTKLWDLEVEAQTTLDDKAVDEFQKYMNDKCYFVNYICGPAYWVGSSICEQWALGAKNSVAVCAMKYDWSVKY